MSNRRRRGAGISLMKTTENGSGGYPKDEPLDENGQSQAERDFAIRMADIPSAPNGEVTYDKYSILTAETYHDLMGGVTMLLKKGWLPMGGMVAVPFVVPKTGKSVIHYCQTVVLKAGSILIPRGEDLARKIAS